MLVCFSKEDRLLLFFFNRCVNDLSHVQIPHTHVSPQVKCAWTGASLFRCSWTGKNQIKRLLGHLGGSARRRLFFYHLLLQITSGAGTSLRAFLLQS